MFGSEYNFGVAVRVKNFSPHLWLIILLPIGLFWRWVFQGQLLYWGTLLYQFWPWRAQVKAALLAGEWPLWNPLLGNGAPLLANLQSAVFYPPNLLYLLMPVEHGLTLSVLLHLGLAGGLMFAYTRRLGLEPFAAALSGLTFMVSGYITGRTQFVVMVNTAAWLPLLLLLTDNMARRRAIADVIGLALTLALSFLAGHAQLWFYSLWLLGAYILVRGRQFNGWKGAAWGLIRLAAATALALLLVSAQLLPTLELMLQSARRTGAERAFALAYSMWPWRLITLLAPNFFGHPATHNYWGYANYWEDHAYMGLIPLTLALIAVRRGAIAIFQKSTPSLMLTPFFAATAFISVVLAMGWNTPLYLWVYKFVPGFGYFQAPARLLIWYTVAVAVLAGIGAQQFELRASARPTLRRIVVGSLGLAMAGWAGQLVVGGRSLTFLPATLGLGLGLAFTAALLLTQPARHDPPKFFWWTRPVWQWALLGLSALDLLLVAWPLLPMLPAGVLHQPTALVLPDQSNAYRYYIDTDDDHGLKFDRYFRFSSFGSPQVEHWQNFWAQLLPNTGVLAGLASANNDDPLTVEHWQTLMTLLRQVNPERRLQLLRLMNVGYVVQAQPETGSAGAPVILVDNPLPRAYFVARARLVATPAEAAAQLTAPDFEVGQEAVIMEPNRRNGLLMSGDTEPAPAAQPAVITAAGANQITLTINVPQPGYVILTDTAYPGWQAAMDGQPAPIYTANLAFRAVAVSAGRHEITFSYRPRTFAMGLGLSLAGLGIVAGIVAKEYRRGSYW
jgi:hypothetical protein